VRIRNFSAISPVPGIGIPGFSWRRRPPPGAFPAPRATMRPKRRQQFQEPLEARSAVWARHQRVARLAARRGNRHRCDLSRDDGGHV